MLRDVLCVGILVTDISKHKSEETAAACQTTTVVVVKNFNTLIVSEALRNKIRSWCKLVGYRPDKAELNPDILTKCLLAVPPIVSARAASRVISAVSFARIVFHFQQYYGFEDLL